MSRKIDFDPIKEDKDGVKAKRMIWSTKTLDLAIKGLGEGRKLVANPFYENNTKLLKGVNLLKLKLFILFLLSLY